MLLGLDFKVYAPPAAAHAVPRPVEPSHVLLGMGMSLELAAGSLRFSFGKDSTAEHVDYAVNALPTLSFNCAACQAMRF